MAYPYDEDPNQPPPGSQPAPGQPQTSPAGAPPPLPPGQSGGYSAQGQPDYNGMRAAAAQGGFSEDYDRYDNATLQEWEKFKDPNCPPDRPYRQDKAHIDQWFGGKGYDPNACVDKPMNQAGAGGGGGGRGGRGGKGGKGGRGGQGNGMFQSDQMAGANDTIWQAIMGRLQGGSRFTPEIMATLQSQMKSQGEGAIRRGQEEANADMQRRGLGRSSLAAGASRDIRTGIEGNMLQSQAQLARAKVDADFQDKTQAINDGMNWLNSLRSYVASMTATQAQKDVALANIQLGYQQLTHATDMMREQHAQELQKLGLTM